jgi:hypothetical protein
MLETKSLVKKIVSGCFGPQEMRNHMLDGIFKQLLQKETFTELLFPGMSESSLRDLPKNLKELLGWEILPLDLTKIARKAASVLNGIKSKGRDRGEEMDAVSEAILVPQIVEEAFARELVETVRRMGKLMSGISARLSTAVASPTECEAEWDQVEKPVIDQLDMKDKCYVGVQNQFLGMEFASLVIEDVKRFVRDEKMSVMRDSMVIRPQQYDPEGIPVSSPEDTEGVSPLPRMAWVEEHTLRDSYPALAEAAQQLHALPFELNGEYVLTVITCIVIMCNSSTVVPLQVQNITSFSVFFNQSSYNFFLCSHS